MSDTQDGAEAFDEALLGRDGTGLSDEAAIDIDADEPIGLPYADADVTDESFAERAARTEPEVWEERPATSVGGAADERLEQILDDSGAVLDEPGLSLERTEIEPSDEQPTED